MLFHRVRQLIPCQSDPNEAKRMRGRAQIHNIPCTRGQHPGNSGLLAARQHKELVRVKIQFVVRHVSASIRVEVIEYKNSLARSSAIRVLITPWMLIPVHAFPCERR